MPGLASISVPSLPVCHYVTISTSWEKVSCQHILELHRHRYYQLYNTIYFNNFNHPPTSFINCRILIKIEKRSRTTSILIVVSLHILTFEIPIQNQNLSWTLDLDWTWSLKLLLFKCFKKLIARITTKKFSFCLFCSERIFHSSLDKLLLEIKS